MEGGGAIFVNGMSDGAYGKNVCVVTMRDVFVVVMSWLKVVDRNTCEFCSPGSLENRVRLQL